MSYAITINSSALRFVKRHEHALSNLKSTALITEFPCDWNSSYGLPLNGANWKWKLSFGCFSEYLVASWFIICFPCLIHTVAVYSEGRREKKFNFRFPVGRHTTMEWMSCATVDFSCFDIRNNSSNEKKKRKKNHLLNCLTENHFDCHNVHSEFVQFRIKLTFNLLLRYVQQFVNSFRFYHHQVKASSIASTSLSV